MKRRLDAAARLAAAPRASLQAPRLPPRGQQSCPCCPPCSSLVGVRGAPRSVALRRPTLPAARVPDALFITAIEIQYYNSCGFAQLQKLNVVELLELAWADGQT